MHFSPRTGETLGSLIEFGFSGDQTLLAYVQTVWGLEKRVPLYVDRAATVIDFFVDRCQLENGFSHGIYDPINDRFTHWFTGILMPFQYSAGEDDVRRYVGRQIAEALTPIAAQLREVEGNYLRTMCESIYPILLAYERTRDRPRVLLVGGRSRGSVSSCCDPGGRRFLVPRLQPEGEGLTSPKAWFGSGYAELQDRHHLPDPRAGRAAPDSPARSATSTPYAGPRTSSSTFVEPVAYAAG